MCPERRDGFWWGLGGRVWGGEGAHYKLSVRGGHGVAGGTGDLIIAASEAEKKRFSSRPQKDLKPLCEREDFTVASLKHQLLGFSPSQSKSRELISRVLQSHREKSITTAAEIPIFYTYCQAQ